MALLETKAVTLRELLGNGRSFSVPPFQRDYSWTEDQWDDLWADILEIQSVPSSEHYMGSIVIQRSDDRRFQIIDGQQSIATLSVFILAAIGRLQALSKKGGEEDEERARLIREEFVRRKEATSLMTVPKLTLNERNKGFYTDILTGQREPASLPRLRKSDRALYDCREFFRSRMTKYDSGADIAQLVDATASRFIFIQITVQDELSAYTVFETLNARGVGLTVTDLLKNYLFSRFTIESDREFFGRRWEMLLTDVSEKRFGQFLRHYALMRRSKVRNERLFKDLRLKVRTGEEALELLVELERHAPLYSALDAPEDPFWSNFPYSRPASVSWPCSARARSRRSRWRPGKSFPRRSSSRP